MTPSKIEAAVSRLQDECFNHCAMGAGKASQNGHNTHNYRYLTRRRVWNTHDAFPITLLMNNSTWLDGHFKMNKTHVCVLTEFVLCVNNSLSL